MPAGRGDRGPRTADPARAHRNRCRYLRGPSRRRQHGAHHPHRRRRDWRLGRCVAGRRGAGRRNHRGWPQRDRPLLQPRCADRAGEDPRSPARRQRADRPPHGRPGLVRWRRPAVVLRAQVATRGRRRSHHPVHRAGRAGVQHPSVGVAQCTGRDRCEGCADPGAGVRIEAWGGGRCCGSERRIAPHRRRLRAHRQGQSLPALSETLSCRYPP